MLCPAHLPSSLSHGAVTPIAGPRGWSISARTGLCVCRRCARHGCISGACDDVCPCSNSGRRGWIHGIHFIWMGTVRMMMINTANPPVCFVLGIRIVQRIHWSFHWGDLEGVCNKTLNLFGLHRALYVSCLWCQIMFSNWSVWLILNLSPTSLLLNYHFLGLQGWILSLVVMV